MLSEKNIKIIKIIFILIFISTVVLLIPNIKNISVENIISFSPKNGVSAAAMILFLYIIKSFSLFFPLTVIYITSGVMFKVIAALSINLVGILINICITYIIGRLFGNSILKKLLKKYSLIQKANELITKNEILSCFILRVLSFLPVDVVGIILGSAAIYPFKYIIGSVLGLIPGMIVPTLIGNQINNENPINIIILSAIFILSSLILTYIFNKKYKNKTHL